MDSFRNYVYQSIKDEILSWDDEIISDIYVISFYISDCIDDPRRPMITLGFNTNSNYGESIAKASGEREAKWNFAFWLQNDVLIIGDNYGENLDDGERITNWIKELGLYYTDEQENDDFDSTLELGEQITHEFVEMCVSIAGQLHKEGIIKGKFGKEIPIIVHELEYYEIIADQNERANPPYLVKEFVDWVYNG